MSEASFRMLQRWSDQFGNQVSLGTTNEADIAGHYTYNPERHRVFVNGTRQLLQYQDVGDPFSFSGTPEYERADGNHRLKPQSSGDVVSFETTERFRYVVQYVVEWSLALRINQPLQSGDVIAVGFGDPDLENATGVEPGPNADGWIVYRNSSMDTGKAVLGEYRNGTQVDAQTISLNKLFQTWGRLGGLTNWYNVGSTRVQETLTKASGEQSNPFLGKVGVPDGKGPFDANKPIVASVKAGNGAGSLNLDVGSIGCRTIGDVDALDRSKDTPVEFSIDTAGEWIPVYAMRVDPDRRITNVQLVDLSVRKQDLNDDVKVLAQMVDPRKALDSGGSQLTESDWSTPATHNYQNSAVEETKAVEQIPNQSGTTSTSVVNPGGYQVGYGSLYATGSGQDTTQPQGNREPKRQVDDRDVCVFLAKAPTTGNVAIEYTARQDY